MVEQVFFQASMPRALSTTFQNIIGQNPDFYVTPTSGLLELWFGANKNYIESPEFKAQDSELMANAFQGFCKQGMFGYFNSITDKKYVMDKSRGHGYYRPLIESFYPEPKIICMVRDLKDVIASFETIFRNNQFKGGSFIKESNVHGNITHKRVDLWLADDGVVGLAITRILSMIQQGYDDKILFIKAEDLCMYPKQQMTRVYEYLKIPYYEHDFDNIEQITSEDDEVYGMGLQLHKIRKKLEMKPSVAKQVLGQDITDFLYNKYKWYYDKFGYRK